MCDIADEDRKVMASSSADADAEDVVIEEIPVFLSRNLQENLYMFQYPTKTDVKNINNASVVNCCVKPTNKEVKVDFALNTETRMYDRFKGEQIAIASDGKKPAKGERPTFKRGIMDKHAYTSSRSVDDVGKFVVGIYTDKEIHLTPLTGILQLRPSFSYFDKEDKRNKAELKALTEDDDDEEYQQVTVKFARRNGANKKLKEKQGYESYMKNINDEPWCETYWHPYTSPTAELERQKLFSTNSQTSHALMLETTKYIEKILPNDSQENRGIDALVPSTIVGKAKLRSMSLSDQLKIILKDAKMLKFDDIMTILRTYVDPELTSEKVLTKLPQVGILIQGNWVAQSEILYPTDSMSNANGVSADHMTRARDYILYRYSRASTLYRREVITATQLPAVEASEVLQSVARLNLEKKWELILPPCREFEQRYPELVQRQEMVWRATEQTYKEMEYEKLQKRPRKRSFRETKAQQMGPPHPYHGANSPEH